MGAALLSVVLAVSLAPCAHAQIAHSTAYASGLGPENVTVCKVQENFRPDFHYEWRCTSQSYTDSGSCPQSCTKSVHANGDGSSLYHCSCPGVTSSQECQDKLGRPAEQIKCVETLAYDHLNCDTTSGDSNRLATKCCTDGQSKCPGPGNVCKVQENFRPDFHYEWRCQSYTDSGSCPQSCTESVHANGDGSSLYHCSCPGVTSSQECQDKLGRPAEQIKCVETLAYDHLNCDTTRGDINWLATKCCTGGQSKCEALKYNQALCSTCASETAGTPGVSEACFAEGQALAQAGKFPVSQTRDNTWGRERLCCLLVLFLSGGVG